VTAGLARGRTNISPHILHDPSRAVQNPARLDLPVSLLTPFYAGLQAVPITGTARIMNTPFMKIQGLTIAGKTGTAQKRTPKGTLNFAWFVGYAPVENPRIAIAVIMEGDTPGEDTGGGRFAAPIANAVLKVWHAKQAAPAVDSPAEAPSPSP
ncbi:MAG: penicillin-binding transpeptidase domain-containing protein, partial [Verrucomicrobiota bacterium]